MKVLLVLLTFLVFSFNAHSQATGNELPATFDDVAWLEEGARKLSEKSLDLAPVTSCRKLSTMFARDGLTDLQKKREWKKYNNKLIPLTGVVVDVDEIPLSDDYLAIFKCVNSDSLFHDFSLRIPGHKEEYAYSLNNGDKHTVALRLRDYGKVSGIDGDMDYFTIDKRGADSEKCKPTLSEVSRKYSQVIYKCNDQGAMFRRILFGTPDNSFGYYEGLIRSDSHEVGALLIDRIREETLFTRKSGEDKSASFHFKSGGNCTVEFAGKKAFENRVREEGVEDIALSYIPKEKSIDRNFEVYQKILRKGLLEDRRLSCSTDQLARLVLYYGLVMPYIEM